MSDRDLLCLYLLLTRVATRASVLRCLAVLVEAEE